VRKKHDKVTPPSHLAYLSLEDGELGPAYMALWVLRERQHSGRGPRLSKTERLFFCGQAKCSESLGSFRNIIAVQGLLAGLQSGNPLKAIVRRVQFVFNGEKEFLRKCDLQLRDNNVPFYW
jgi:hypothetical protein